MAAIEHPARPLDAEEARRVRRERLERIGKWLLPLLIMVLAIWLWDRICVWTGFRNISCRGGRGGADALFRRRAAVFLAVVTLMITLPVAASAVVAGGGFGDVRAVEMC